MVREAVFNILGDRIVGAVVADLYAGAGSLGFEALSRGARSVLFVERDRGASRLVQATAARFQCSDRVHIVTGDVEAWLRHHPDGLSGIDVCFADPPYHDARLDDVVELISRNPPQVLVVEHHRSRMLSGTVGHLVRVRERTYGLTGLSLFRRQGPPAVDDGGVCTPAGRGPLGSAE